MTSSTDITEFLKAQLPGRGTEQIVGLGYKGAGAGYYKKEFVDSCLDEMEKVVMRKVLGEDPTPLEVLAIQLLLESAYFKTFEELNAAFERSKNNV